MASDAAHPAPAWRRRWERWWQDRHPRTDSLVLTQRNVYIVPTGAGALFAALLAVLLVASINYQLNLGYLLTFVLAGAGLSSMVSTHATLRGLRLHLGVVEPVFAGDSAILPITLRGDPRGRARYGIGLALHPQAAQPGHAPTWVELPAGGQTLTHLALRLGHRGWHAIAPIVVETRFPFGLFRAWSYWRPATAALAWPQPETPMPALPWSQAEPGSLAPRRRAGGEEADGVRAWRRGDALSQVLWKRSAQALAGGGELVTRERGSATSARLLLRWADTPSLDAERRLARIAAWVLGAERAGVPYALALPGLAIESGHGPLQQRQCLDALAGWGQAPPGTPAP